VIRLLLSFFILFNLTYAAKVNRTFDCTKIFEERKQELIERLENIDDQEQSLEALREATATLLDKKKVKIEAQLTELKKVEASVKSKEENIKKLLADNQKVLDDIQKAKLNKISTLYSKMKAGAAALVFTEMDIKEATTILNSLPPKALGKIFAKMDAKKAAELTHEMSLSPKK
jgi:flagellar motility protein MotE (MotC chaperone)